MDMNPWSRLGLRAVAGRATSGAAWILLPVLGGLSLGRYGRGLSPDALLLIGLIALLVEGLLAYDLMLRNAALVLVATLPVPPHALRCAYRHQMMLIGAALLSAAGLTAANLVDLSPAGCTPLVYVAVPVIVGLPIFSASLCHLSRGLTRPGEDGRLLQKLGGSILPPETTPLIYGSAAVFAGLGSWLVGLHLMHRVWTERGQVAPLLVLLGLGALASVAALVWIDRRGLGYLTEAAPRLRFLDHQGLLLATPHQAPSRALEAPGPAGATLLLRLQVGRRFPLWLPAVAALVALAAARTGYPLGTELAAAAALGLTLDVPDRWLRARLVTDQALGLLGGGEGRGSLPAARLLLRPALLLQVGVALVTFAAGLALGAPLADALIMAAALLGAGVLSGMGIGPRSAGAWSAIRLTLAASLAAVALLAPGAGP